MNLLTLFLARERESLLLIGQYSPAISVYWFYFIDEGTEAQNSQIISSKSQTDLSYLPLLTFCILISLFLSFYVLQSLFFFLLAARVSKARVREIPPPTGPPWAAFSRSTDTLPSRLPRLFVCLLRDSGRIFLGNFCIRTYTLKQGLR